MKKRPDPLEIVKRVGDLPDDVLVHDSVAAILLGTSPRSLRRNSPVRKITTGLRTSGRRLGDIRALLRGEQQPSAA
jgi:hypothetical protein